MRAYPHDRASWSVARNVLHRELLAHAGRLVRDRHDPVHRAVPGLRAGLREVVMESSVVTIIAAALFCYLLWALLRGEKL
jgi:hypothetical protein